MSTPVASMLGHSATFALFCVLDMADLRIVFHPFGDVGLIEFSRGNLSKDGTDSLDLW